MNKFKFEHKKNIAESTFVEDITRYNEHLKTAKNV